MFVPFHTFTPGVKVGQELRRAACALHPVHPVSASPLGPGIHGSASPRLRFPMKMSTFTQKPWENPRAAVPTLFFSLILPSFPSFHSLLLSHQSLFPVSEVLSCLSRDFLHNLVCSTSDTFHLCDLGQILNFSLGLFFSSEK